MLNLYHYKSDMWQLAWTTHDEALAMEWGRLSPVPARFQRLSGTVVWFF